MSGVKQPLIVQGRAGGWANLKMVAGFLDFGDTFLNIDFVAVFEGLGGGVVGVGTKLSVSVVEGLGAGVVGVGIELSVSVVEGLGAGVCSSLTIGSGGWETASWLRTSSGVGPPA